jgi:hypothetical protein
MDDSVNEETAEPAFPSNKNVDKITLELLMNNQMYNKYLSKADPQKYEENQKFKEKLQRYKARILKMTDDLIDDPKKSINNEIFETFSNYVNSCVKFIETKDLEEQTTKDSYSSDDEDVLFDEKYMNPSSENTAIDFPKSYWGCPVVKSKNPHIDNDIRAFASKKYRR